MSEFGKFTYPFCYVPHPKVVEAARALIERIDSDPALHSLFAEGKMMGVLLTDRGPLYAFSGLACGLSHVEGFVPPIYDTQNLVPAVSADDSRRIQEDLFLRYVVHNALGNTRSVKEIFAERGLVPPGGTGDCAAPKLLEHAYRNGMHPLAMGEFWYGAPGKRQVREQGCFYPSCTGKCGPLLTFMMQGLDVEPNPLDKGFLVEKEPQIIYCDDHILVVDKPAGMLSVPGRTESANLLDYLRSIYGEVHSCHRLDMDTSGIMVYARDMACKSALEAQFAARQVHKVYRARLVANGRPFTLPRKGTIALPLITDWDHRPMQEVNYETGKLAVTEYEVLDFLPNGEVDIRFYPRTGRTHQLRVHAAHSKGLAHPIKGDRLYGQSDGSRLYLHAESITFTHPATGEVLTFLAPDFCGLVDDPGVSA